LVIEISIAVEIVEIFWVAACQKETGAIYVLLGIFWGRVFHLGVPLVVGCESWFIPRSCRSTLLRGMLRLPLRGIIAVTVNGGAEANPGQVRPN
jgi:hypothetical protein